MNTKYFVIGYLVVALLTIPMLLTIERLRCHPPEAPGAIILFSATWPITLGTVGTLWLFGINVKSQCKVTYDQ